MEETTQQFQLPGFRFHPTEEELLEFYLKNIVFAKKLRFDVIGLLNIYHHDPWDLPGLAKIGEREWYFFVPRDRKHGIGGRPNRTTETGFWKATGSDRRIFSLSDTKKTIGLRKTLVFYKGRAPRGSKTDWVMNEYRLPDNTSTPKDIVLCKIYRKATSLKVLEQRAAMEDEMKPIQSYDASSLSPRISSVDTISFSGNQQDQINQLLFKTETDQEIVVDETTSNNRAVPSTASSTSSIKQPSGCDILTELQVPKMNMDWTQDPFWNQFNSPWLQNFTPYANILNF